MHVMLDLETWGTKPGSAIRSIGAVAFDLPTGYFPDNTFYRNIDDESCINAGLLKDAKTEIWWEAQSPAAQLLLAKDQVPLAEALSDFYSWFKEVQGAQVWSQGAAFDIPLLEWAYHVTGVTVPWKYFNARDTRTVYDIAKLAYHDEPREGVEHYALHDCFHQIKLVQMAYARLGK